MPQAQGVRGPAPHLFSPAGDAGKERSTHFREEAAPLFPACFEVDRWLPGTGPAAYLCTASMLTIVLALLNVWEKKKSKGYHLYHDNFMNSKCLCSKVKLHWNTAGLTHSYYPGLLSACTPRAEKPDAKPLRPLPALYRSGAGTLATGATSHARLTALDSPECVLKHQGAHTASSPSVHKDPA